MSLDVFLMITENIDIKELQCIINENFKGIENDVWSELNIMQLELNDGNFIDFAEIKEDKNFNEVFDKNDRKYIEDKNFKKIYCITYEPDNSDIVINIVKIILERYHGILGSDTDNFEPILISNI